MDDSGLGKFILDKLEKLDDKLDDVKIKNAESRKAFETHEKKDEGRHRDMQIMGEQIMARLDDQCSSLKEYNKQLEIHIEGVNTLKQSHDAMWKRVEPVVDKYEKELTARTWWSDRIKARVKWVTTVGAVAGSIVAVMKLFDMF